MPTGIRQGTGCDFLSIVFPQVILTLCWLPALVGCGQQAGEDASTSSPPATVRVGIHDNVAGAPILVTGNESLFAERNVDPEEAMVRLPRTLEDTMPRLRQPDAPALVAGALGDDRLAEVRRDWPKCTFVLKLDQTLILNLENQARWAMASSSERLTSMPNYLNYIAPEPLREEAPESITLIHGGRL